MNLLIIGVERSCKSEKIFDRLFDGFPRPLTGTSRSLDETLVFRGGRMIALAAPGQDSRITMLEKYLQRGAYTLVVLV